MLKSHHMMLLFEVGAKDRTTRYFMNITPLRAPGGERSPLLLSIPPESGFIHTDQVLNLAVFRFRNHKAFRSFGQHPL